MDSMKTNELQIIGKVAALVTAVFCLGGDYAQAQISTENLPFSKSSGTVDGCPGSYTGLVKFTNSAGTVPLTLVTPPLNTTSGTLTDASSFGSNYVSRVYAVRASDFNSWCGTNSVSFPVSTGDQFYLTIYVKNSPPPPTNGQPIVAQINWQH